MCKSKWNSEGLPSFEAVMQPATQAALRKVPFVAGGMIFAKGSLLSEVPFDPGLDWVFSGEEVLLSARFYTHGWDMFTPLRNVILHHYAREESPRFWNDLKNYRHKQLQSIERIKRLMGLQAPPITHDRYGMGNARSMQEYWSFSGLDPVNKTSKSVDVFCDRLP